ncbi:MAG TPA: ATP-binding cassette domain-containing protein, partial [Methylomirabilota bacterium]|nr:ATP-binding cassette domain-containing protein [Methylomirabilota bacterium]
MTTLPASPAEVTRSYALRLQAVSKSVGGLRAVDGVELAVRPGERRALIGPNGAGKTTLFNLIAGALPVSSGRITLFDTDVTGVAQHRRAALGLARTYQITNLFPALTVAQNVRLAAQARTPARFAMLRPVSGFPRLEAQARDALAAVGLENRAGA